MVANKLLIGTTSLAGSLDVIMTGNLSLAFQPHVLMLRSRAHPNQWDVGLILPPTRKSALECLSKWNLLLANLGEFDLPRLQQNKSEDNGGAHGVSPRER